jgi:hypothetical protein
MKKILRNILFSVSILLLLFAGYLFIGVPPRAEKIDWGVNFSQKHAKNLGLDWKETYLALLYDLGTKNLKVAAHWDLLEPEKNKYYFDDLDWQVKEAENHSAKILLAIGMKTPRWPECHIPEWAINFSKEEQQKEILEMLKKVVLRYKDSKAIEYWQVENEPFFPFGDCPWVDKNFLKEEIELVKSLDPSHPVVVSDSGEGSFWVQAAKLGDIVGTTMYKKVWFRQLGIYVYYPLPPTFYWRKAEYIKKIFDKKVIVVELQAEPWGPKLLYDSPVEEQEKTMNLKQFQKNVEFAKRTGFGRFYFWGAEWWYWSKEKQNNPQIWDEAKSLFVF